MSITSDFEYRTTGVPVVICLVSKTYVSWQIRLPSANFPLVEVFVIDASGGGSTYVKVVDQMSRPVTIHVRKTNQYIYGYGQDTASDHSTPKVIRLVESYFGTIRSFSGSVEADKWNLVVRGM